VPAYRQKLLGPTREDYINALKFYAARYALSGNHAIVARLFRTAQSVKHHKSDGSSTRAEAMV